MILRENQIIQFQVAYGQDIDAYGRHLWSWRKTLVTTYVSRCNVICRNLWILSKLLNYLETWAKDNIFISNPLQFDDQDGINATWGRSNVIFGTSKGRPTNQEEGWALHQKATRVVCKFLLKEVICHYGCVGKIIAYRGKLDSKEAK